MSAANGSSQSEARPSAQMHMARAMTAGELKRSITIAGHRTSISLEEEFWEELRRAAARENIAMAALIASIDGTRGKRNLSSAIRVWLLKRLQGGAGGTRTSGT
jgi:predicted DNA-binding ribbon-helix-helix protein